jgi:hypothetical protein
MSSSIKSIKKILLFLLLPLLITSKLELSKVIHAINCGYFEYYTDKNGIVYSPDKFFDGGKTSDYGINYDISNTDDMIIYQTERWSSETITYSLPIKEEGIYTLILKFSEVYFTRANEKVFDIALGKKTVIKNLDIYDKVGKGVAYDEYIEFTLKNNKIYFEGKECNNAFENQELKVKFVKGSKDNPKVNGIILYKGNKLQTDYIEVKKRADENKRKLLNREKKKLNLDLRHHPDENYDDETLANIDINELKKREQRGFLNLLETKLGMFTLISIGIFFILNTIL